MNMEHSTGFIGSLISLAALLGLAVVGLPIFAVHFKRSGRRTSERISRLGGSPLLGLYVMEYGYWLARLPLRVARSLGASPDLVTLVGLGFVLAASTLIGLGYFAVGGWVFLVGCVFDVVDGMLARETSTCSDAGEYLDAIVDRYSEFAIFAGLTVYYRNDLAAMALMLAALLGAIMVSYNRAKAEALGVHDAPGWLMRRHERGVYIGIGVALAPLISDFVEPGAARPHYYLALLAAATVASLANLAALRLMVEVRQRLRALAARPHAQAEDRAA